VHFVWAIGGGGGEEKLKDLGFSELTNEMIYISELMEAQMNNGFRSIKKGLTEAIAHASGKPGTKRRLRRTARALLKFVEKSPKTVSKIASGG
jgi:hypothetical protein